jgi:hypothetical protein
VSESIFYSAFGLSGESALEHIEHRCGGTQASICRLEAAGTYQSCTEAPALALARFRRLRAQPRAAENSMIGWGKTLMFGRESYSRRFRTSPRA